MLFSLGWALLFKGLKTPTGKKLFKAATGRDLPTDFEALSVEVQARQYNLFVRRLKSVEARGEVYDAFEKMARSGEVDGNAVAAVLESSLDEGSIGARKLLQAYSHSWLKYSIKNNVKMIGGRGERNLKDYEIQELEREFTRFVDQSSAPIQISEVKEFFEERGYTLMPTFTYKGEIIARGEHIHLLPSSVWLSLSSAAMGLSIWGTIAWHDPVMLLFCLASFVGMVASGISLGESRDLRRNVDERYLE